MGATSTIATPAKRDPARGRSLEKWKSTSATEGAPRRSAAEAGSEEIAATPSTAIAKTAIRFARTLASVDDARACAKWCLPPAVYVAGRGLEGVAARFGCVAL